MQTGHEYSIIIETLKSLYQKKETDISKIKDMLNKSIITLEEYDYILGKKKEV